MSRSDPAHPSPRLRVALLAGLAIVVLVGGLSLRRPEVLVIGDSITEWGAEPLDTNLRWSFRVTSVGHAGYRIDEMLPDARTQAAAAPHRVIVNLGTNDALMGWPTEQSEASLRELMGLFPARCLALVTVTENAAEPGSPGDRHVAALNAMIRRVAAERGALVVDWAEALRAHLAAGSPGGALTIDLVHPSLLGYERLAGLYTDALARCP